MEDDEKKRKNPYKLKEEFPNTIKIKPEDEQPKAPAEEAPAEETPTAGQSEAPAAEAQEVETPAEETPVNPTPTSVEPTDVTPTENTEVSPAPTTEETAVEKTDGTDVDGATGVASQEAGDTEQAVEQNTTAIPTTETEGAQNQGLEGQNTQSTGGSGQVVASPDAASDAASQNLANAGNNATDNNEGGDNTAPDTNGRSGGSASGTRTSVQTPYEFTPETYNPDEDPNVIAIRNANQTMEDAYLGKPILDKDGKPMLDENGDVMRDDSGQLSKFDAMMEDFKKYDEERTRRDAANAFWRGVGEAGGALVNFLGVSGAFGGKNAYGRGAYSSMQKFDLTTGKLTDKMWADIDKRKERMDALREKQRELGLQFAAVMAKGKENEGKAAAEGQKAVDQRNLTREGWKFTSTENAWQRDWQGKENDKNRAAKKEKDKVYDTFSYYIKGGGGKKKYLVAERTSLDHAFATTSGQLADAIARDMGYDSYDDYALAVENGTVVNRNAVEKWNAMSDEEKAKAAGVTVDKWQKMNAKKKNEVFNEFAAKESKDFEVNRRRLEAYETAKELRPFIGEDNKVKSGTDQWARDIAQYYEEYGDAVYDWLRVHGLLYTDDDDIIDYNPDE